MFEAIIASFIKRYVARYIDINADQLSAQLLYKRQIIIENLTLNKTILNEDIRTKFKLPIKIESIHIGKIQCSFIWSSLFFRSSSAAFIVKIERVRAVVKSTEDESPAENFEENDANKKRDQLDLVEQQLEKEFECFGEVKSSKWNVQRLLMSFFEKLQIDIVDIHISYESFTSDNIPYTIGLTCGNVQISNELSDETISRQVFRIIDPAFYIDINNPLAHAYILSPANSMEIYLIHNHFTVGQKEFRYEFECSINDLNMKCNIEQIRILTDIVRFIRYANLRRMLISDPSRPRSKISKQSAKSWWRYATLIILRSQVDLKYPTTHFWFDRTLLLHRLHQLNTYKRLYRAYLDDKYFNCSNFTSRDELTMNEIEREFDIEYLLIIRRSIFQTRINEQLNEKREVVGWYSTYAKWITTKVIDLWGRIPTSEDILNENDMKIQEQVNTFIAESLEDEDLLESYHDALIFRFKFDLKSVQIDLLSSSVDILFKFYLKNLSFMAEFRLRHQSILISLRLEDLCVRDQRQMDQFSTIISSKKETPQVPMFELSFEKKARSKSTKTSVYSIGLRSCGFCIVCCPGSVERLCHFYGSSFGQSSLSPSSFLYQSSQTKESSMKYFIAVLEQILSKSKANSKSMTSSHLLNARRNRYRKTRKFHVYVDMGAPKIIIPLPSQRVLIADLGWLTLTNDESTLHSKNEMVTPLPLDDDDEEFLTPDGSPLINDDPMETETNFYSINLIPTDPIENQVEYSSFSLSLRDIQLGYATDFTVDEFSQIIEKFDICFLVQHPINHLWPLKHISGTLQKMNVHLDSQRIQTLCSALTPWISFVENFFVVKQHYPSNTCPGLVFHLSELNLRLNALCDICVQNIDLSLMNNIHSKNLTFTLQILTMVDAMQQYGKDYEFILKTDRTSNINDYFIRVNIHLPVASEICEESLTIEVNADKLDFVFNPETFCALVNFASDIDLLFWCRTIFGGFDYTRKQKCCKINSTLRELNILFTHIRPIMLMNGKYQLEKVVSVHVRNVSLNITLNPFSVFEVMMDVVQIFDLLSNQQQTIGALTSGHRQTDLIIDLSAPIVSKNSVFHLLLTNTENSQQDLSTKIASVSYFHSFKTLDAMQEILDYITRNCHLFSKQDLKIDKQIVSKKMMSLLNQFTRSTLSIDLDTSLLIFRIESCKKNNVALQVRHIRIQNGHDQLSAYIDRIDLLSIDLEDESRLEAKKKRIRLDQHLSWPLLNNISIDFSLRVCDGMITIDSKLISSLRIFLGQHQIKILQQILSSLTHRSSTIARDVTSYAFRLQSSSDMIIVFQADRNYELITMCEAILRQCQMSIERKRSFTLRFDSLHINDRLVNFDENLISLISPSIIELNDNKIDIKLGEIDIKLITSTWAMLSEIIGIIDGGTAPATTTSDRTEIQEKKKHATFFNNDSIQITINIDTITCLFKDNIISLMKVFLQRFNCQIQTSPKQSVIKPTKNLVINGQLGFISIRDLSSVDQLYHERLRTNTLVFNFTTEEDHGIMSNVEFLARPQLSLRMATIQYIHTQRFLLDLLHFFDRFQRNEDFYHRIRSVIIKPVFFKISKRLDDILLNIEAENIACILPEHILKESVFIFQLGSIHFKNHFLFQNKSNNQPKKVNYRKSQLDFILIEIKDMEFYPAFYYLFDSRIVTSVCFSNFGFNRIQDDLSSMVRERFHLNIEIEHNLDQSMNRTSPTYSIKMNLSSIEILFDLNQYRLIQNILAYNINEQSASSLILFNNLFSSLTIINDDICTDFAVILEIDRVGLEIFVRNTDLLSFNHHHSLGYSALIKLHISFDQYSNGNQVLHLICSSMKLIDTRIQQVDMIVPLSNSSQLEIHLLRTKLDDQCTLTLNSIRFLFVIDWLIELNEFLNSFCQEQIINTPGISIKQLEMKLNLNRFELVLVPTTKDPYSNGLVYSSTMSFNYRKTNQHRPLECSMTDLTFFTCQIGNIDETVASIIEPTDVSLNVHNEQEGQICELDIPMLNIRLSYSDVKMLYSMFESISKQISQAKTRKPLLSFISAILTSPVRDHQSSRNGFLNVKFLKFMSDQICLCLIDDCLGVNIPLLNISLKSFKLQTIENSDSHRSEQNEFQLNISYYNRFQSGFEPLIETCLLQMTLIRSLLSNSLFISSNEVLNLNCTKALYRLYNTVEMNWLAEYHNSKSIKKRAGFRRVKPLDPYCFKNSVGVQIKFRTWSTVDQRFASHEHIVNDNQTISFNFSNEQTKQCTQTPIRRNSVVSSLFQSDRRLLILIDGWEWLQPISIDRVGIFFRLAVPSDNNGLYKPMLVIIDVAMTDNSIRSITMRSSIEIRNQLLTSIDMQFKSNLDSMHEFCLEPNEIRSLPIQLCSMLQQIQVRPTDFALGYCNEPINWTEIENETMLSANYSTGKSLSLEEKIPSRQSFLRACSIDGKEAVYYVCLQSKQTRLFVHNNRTLSIYQLSILPPLTICNLLPRILTIEMPPYPQKLEVNAYKSHREHTLNTNQGLEFLFGTEHYHMNKPLRLPSIDELQKTKYTRQRIIFYDNIQRELFVDITIVCLMKHRLKISVSVPYVLLNKSGIPLIFKDINSKTEAAGQDAEDEMALNKRPLLFAFENASRNNTCVMRVGTGLHHHQDGRSQWSHRFSLEHGSSYQQLHVRGAHNSPDWVYSIGIDVRPGNGPLRKTNFIFLSARYMISNQCSYDLLIAQRHIAQTMLSTDDDQNCLYVFKHATIAYHWPRTDIEQLLCVRGMDDRQHVNWSSGFSIDCVNAFYINMRYDNGQCLILRVQVIERNGTYFLVFMDANQMPAPFRISNRSDVPIQFYQTDIKDEFPYLRTIVQPQQSIDYALDEPTLKPTITCSIADGTKVTYDLLKLGPADDLHRQNYIYLALQETFDDHNLMQRFFTSNNQLVIEYTNDRLLLASREENKRSQLWHMTSNGVLIHIGSSPSHDWNKKKDAIDDIRQAFVLDIEGLANDALDNLMTHFTQLIVRRYDPKRISTQTWQFRDSGYLCMNNTQMCVQIFGELTGNSDVVLGAIAESDNLIPPVTMHIRPQQQYKGSGVLSVRIIPDGPTNVLEIDHIKADDLPAITTVSSPPSSVYHIDLHFAAGVGISVVGSIGHESEELIYALINNFHLKYIDKANERSIEAIIGTMIISNQLLTTTKPCLFYVTYTDDASVQSAIRLQANWQKLSANFTFLHIIRSLHIDINSITIQLDEILLWKLIDFFDIEISSLLSKTVGIDNNSNSDRRIDLNVNDYETERILSLLTSIHATRIYFNKLYLSSIDLNLSVYCLQSKRSLPSHLLAIKRRASFPLVPFENAQIHLKAYEQTHISNTYNFFLLSIRTHYINVCTRQALKILGSVDFLGNPLGLIHDVTDGLACLVDQRSVAGLVKNVAHGVANSTSKVTGSLSHGLGKLVADSEHDNRRQAKADNNRSNTFGHVIRHGTAGIAAGLYGGLTSMIKQPIKGAVEDGVPGLVKGFAKGIVGTVSKPMVGILDFTNDVAIAVKDGARSPNAILNNRIRLTRCSSNILRLLQPYSTFDAHGHYLLYKMNKGNLSERYITRITLSSITPMNNTSDKRVLTTNSQSNKNASNKRGDYVNAMITTQRVIIYRTDDDSDVSTFETINSYDFNTSINAVPIEDDDGHAYVQFLLDSKTAARSITKANQSIHRCDTLEQASTLSREIQRAQEIFQEEKMIYIVSDDETEDNYDDILDE